MCRNVFESVEEFLKRYKDVDEEIYCIGGGMIYSEMLAYADKLVLTEIDEQADALRFIFLNLTSLCIQKQYYLISKRMEFTINMLHIL